MSAEVVETPFGKFLIDPGELISETTRAGTLWDGPGFLIPIAQQYGELGTPGVAILDIGANQGMFSVWLAQQGAWRVIAVEPVQVVMDRLKANLDLNRPVTQASVIPLQVAAFDTYARFHADPLDPGNWGGTALERDREGGDIRGEALDNYRFLYGRKVSLIKVDAQGADGRALRGLVQTICRDQPVIVFEWEAGLAETRYSDTLESFLAWLQDHGYQVNLWPAYANNYLALPARLQR